MKQTQEFEIITDKNTNFKIFMNVLKYRTPHLHMDYEIGFVMNGHLDLIYEEGETYHLHPGDFMCVNPYQIHEFKADDTVRLLLLQINPAFFRSIYPQIKNMEFIDPVISLKAIRSASDRSEMISDGKENITEPQLTIKPDSSDALLTSYKSAYSHMFDLAIAYMEQKADFELKCAGLLSLLFYDLMGMVDHRNVSHSENEIAHNKATRMRHISDYIDQHQDEKLLLSDIAEYEGLTLSYLSHFFKDNYHMSFQEYVTRLRCERARNLLLTTELSILDISITCGFSDPKYFKSGFIRQYGCTPKDYRLNFGKQKLSGQQTSMLTTQQIMSRQTSLVLLQQYLDSH